MKIAEDAEEANKARLIRFPLKPRSLKLNFSPAEVVELVDTHV